MDRKNIVAILFSGGTDSTCAAAVMAERFNTIHLLTFKRSGFYCIENASRNVDLLRNKFASVIFEHNILEVERLAKYIAYNHFLRRIFKYGFFILSNCLICGLINHFRTLSYCLDENIGNVADGSTREWSFFPTHMESIIMELKKMYAKFNIKYETPVYDFGLPSHLSFIDKIFPVGHSDTESEQNTTGKYLFKLGIFPHSNLKGSIIDRNMQPRCLQFILHHIYLFWYFMPRNNYSDFEKVTLGFFKESINDFIKLIEDKPKKLRSLLINCVMMVYSLTLLICRC